MKKADSHEQVGVNSEAGGSEADPRDRLRLLWSGLLGVFFAACIVKYANPVILDDPAAPSPILIPMTPAEAPTNTRYLGLGAIALLGFTLSRRPRGVPRWVMLLPLVWLGWQFVAAVQTVDTGLTTATLKHFIGCVACFFLGLLVLGGTPNAWPFWAGLLLGFSYSLVVGWDQHFRGLEAMRQYFYLYSLPKIPDPPPELLKRIESRRIFGTFVYANALAGSILLLLPGLAGFLWHAGVGSRRRAGRVAAFVLSVASAACLFWTGSKAGWLVATIILVVWVLQIPWSGRLKLGLGVAILVLGGLAFTLRFASYFERGATSVSARFQYWEAAVDGFRSRPLWGTGPGTFGVIYRRVKPPEAEMAQLTHNDYLEQASDSGLVGFGSYAAFWLGSLVLLGRWSWQKGWGFAVWLGLLGWGLHGVVEFGLYIPASAWPAFTLLGWLWARVGNESTTSASGPSLRARHENSLPQRA